MVRMRSWAAVLLSGLGLAAAASADTVVFHEPGFPVVESEALSRETLQEALAPLAPRFVGLEELRQPETLRGADLLVLPHGSAFPADAWAAVRAYLEGGGNLLNLGGRPLWTCVFRDGTGYRLAPAGDRYWRLLAAVDATEVPRRDFARFAWEDLWGFGTKGIRARRAFAVTTRFVANFASPEGRWRGLGFFHDAASHRIAAPVARLDFSLTPADARAKGRGRMVMLAFEPEPGYWASEDGRSLVREAARHAARGPALAWVEVPRASLLEGESAGVVVHVQDRRASGADAGRVRLELLRDGNVLESRTVACPGGTAHEPLTFAGAESPGLYAVRARYERDGGIVDAHETGFWRRDPALLAAGARLTAGPTYLRRDGKPFLVVGVNHWVNDTVWPFFPENGNALEWDRDFAEMAARGLNFVRTGIWFDRLMLVDRPTGGAREPVLRNLEALLHAAGRHGLHVQFTFFSFEPGSLMRSLPDGPSVGRNPYTDPVAVEAQATFVRSIVSRFKDVPFLSWDLVNEPSFSNPRALWRGNQPKGDPTELEAWNEWLRRRYGKEDALAGAWGVVPEDLPPLGAVPLPAPEDLALTRNGNPRQVRALDYNLFAQDAFSRWAAQMVEAIRATGSLQLVAVGQDEGGVTTRLLNQFYGGSGVDMTSMHSWWQDDALLWDAVAAKRPGVPNLLGETAPQPALAMDGRSRWDETGGLALYDRKLALGMAAGNAGVAAWIWSRSDPYHIGRPDGSSTLWLDRLTAIAGFAKRAEPHLSDARASDVAIVLPQSLQLSVLGHYGLEAQQRAVRALYHEARASAEVVGEHQVELLGRPRLILLPSPWVLGERAWEALLDKARAGATLLATGRIDLDEHFRPKDRLRALSLAAEPATLAAREHPVRWPGGAGRAVFSGDKTTWLEQAVLPGGESFARRTIGRGQLLYFPLPLELNDDLRLLGDVYRWALAEAGVEPLYRTALDDPGILICPTPLETGTLYVLTSESSVAREVRFRDVASGKDVRVDLAPGRAALVLVTRKGEVVRD
jgi:hypothetical protein